MKRGGERFRVLSEKEGGSRGRWMKWVGESREAWEDEQRRERRRNPVRRNSYSRRGSYARLDSYGRRGSYAMVPGQGYEYVTDARRRDGRMEDKMRGRDDYIRAKRRESRDLGRRDSRKVSFSDTVFVRRY